MKNEFEKIVDYKDAKIGKRQDVKTESIFISGSARDATLMVTTFYNKIKDSANLDGKIIQSKQKEDIIKEIWQYWQKFFYDQMTGQMPTPYFCPTCGGEMQLSKKGDWYCPGYYDERNEKHHPKQELTKEQSNFLKDLK